MEDNIRSQPLWKGVLRVTSLAEKSDAQGSQAGGKVRLPPSALERILDNLPDRTVTQPLTFHIRLPGPETDDVVRKAEGTTKGIYTGVLEFSAPEGHIILAPGMWETLSDKSMDESVISEGKEVQVEEVHLPKGSWVKLAATEEEMVKDGDDGTKVVGQEAREPIPLGQLKPTLESALRSHHTALYLGEKLSTPFGPHTYVFRVLELKPASAVSIVDTDLEVDLVEMMSQSLPRLGSSIKGKLCPVTWGSPLYVPWTGLTGEVGEDEDLEHGYGGNRVVRYFRIPLASIGNDRQIRVSVQSAGLNIDIRASVTVERPRFEDAWWWLPVSSGKGTMVISLNEASVQHYEVLYLAISALIPDRPIQDPSMTLIVGPLQDGSLEDDKSDDSKDTSSSSSRPTDAQPDWVECPGCHQWMPPTSLLLHERMCSRHTKACPTCGVPMLNPSGATENNHTHCPECSEAMEARFLNAHVARAHTLRTCPCQEEPIGSLEPFVAHHRSSCPVALILCRYCRLLQPRGPMSLGVRERQMCLTEHEAYCGGRTIRCVKCGASVRIRDVRVHAAIHAHDRRGKLTRASPPPFKVCSNTLCTREKAKETNPLGLCSRCYGPFWAPVQDPGWKRLLVRMARKYHGQLTEGCGSQWCRNEYCATGKGGKTLEATEAAALLPPLLKIGDLDIPRYFCVDETTSNRAFWVEILQGSEVGSEYGRAWCIRALDEAGEDVDRATSWLKEHGGRR